MNINLKIEISKDKKITLTEEEARELYGKLDEMFGEKLNYWIDWQVKPEPFINPYFPNQPSVMYDISISNGTGGKFNHQPNTTTANKL